MLQESPIIGIGFGHKLTFDLLGWPLTIEVRELHNNFIGIALQMGILGFLSFVLFNALVLKKFIDLRFKIIKKYYPHLLSAFGCYILFLFSANFGTYFDVNVLNIFFWITLGIIVSLENINKKLLQKQQLPKKNEE